MNKKGKINFESNQENTLILILSISIRIILNKYMKGRIFQTNLYIYDMKIYLFQAIWFSGFDFYFYL